MKVAITGSESFVGRELISQCTENKIDVIGFDTTAKTSALNYEFYKIDIRDKKISEYLSGVDILIHLAALSRDPDCKGKAITCFDINVMGTLNLIESAKEKKIKQFIFASSEWVYDKFENYEEKDEDSQINVSNHMSEYALSKLVSECNLRQQFASGFCDVTILRFGIIYGPRKTNWAAVESIASSVKHKSEITVNSLKNGRRFVYVSDIANGIIKSFGLKGFNIINLTGNTVITMNDIIKTSEKIFGKSIQVFEKNPTEINIRNPSNQKAKKLLNWSPLVNLEMGIKSIQSFL